MNDVANQRKDDLRIRQNEIQEAAVNTDNEQLTIIIRDLVAQSFSMACK